MNKRLFLLSLVFLHITAMAQTAIVRKDEMRTAANRFLESLSPAQKGEAQFAFGEEERFHWNFVPMPRKGIALKQLNGEQEQLAMALLRLCLSDAGYQKTKAIIALEAVLKVVENRRPDDEYRDPGRYYFSIFGNPAADSLWGWRLEGHHVSFNFTADEKGLLSGTPGFLGANPAMVLAGPQKGEQVLREETEKGFAFLHSLVELQKQKAIISKKAPADIITGASRKARIEKPEGILYDELTKAQQQLLEQLLHLYLERYKGPLAAKMWKDIVAAGLGGLSFAWAGAEQPGLGNPHYYRIHGPTLLIEYDNTQNNANHVHTVVRDLVNDFGGDALQEHYQRHRH